MPKYGRVDANHSAVGRALQQAGCSVQSLAAVGSGVPDYLCAIGGLNFLVEVKDGTAVPSERRLTTHQVAWHKDWNAPVFVIKNAAQGIDLVNVLRIRVLPVFIAHGLAKDLKELSENFKA